jgi:hypothetical protein
LSQILPIRKSAFAGLRDHEENDRSSHRSSLPSEQTADQYPGQQRADDALRRMCGDTFLGFLEKLVTSLVSSRSWSRNSRSSAPSSAAQQGWAIL